MKTPAILSFVVLLAQSSFALAADLLVPSQYSSIQAAVDAAQNGDRVLIAPGTYVGSVVINSKSISLEGSGPVGSAKIDLQGASTDGISISGTAATEVVVKSLQIRNSLGNAISITGASVDLVDAWCLSGRRGIRVDGAGHAQLTRVQIVAMGGVDGAGIFVGPGASIVGSTVGVSGISAGGLGGALHLSIGATASFSEVAFSTTSSTSGTIYCDTGSSLELSDISVTSCSAVSGGLCYLRSAAVDVLGITLQSVTATGAGGAVWMDGGTLSISGISANAVSAGGLGGLVFAQAGTVGLTDATISSVRSETAGALLHQSSGTCEVTDVVVSSSSTRVQSGYVGGFVALGDVAFEATNLVLAGNTVTTEYCGIAPSGGALIHAGASARSFSLTRCNFDSVSCVDWHRSCGFGGCFCGCHNYGYGGPNLIASTGRLLAVDGSRQVALSTSTFRGVSSSYSFTFVNGQGCPNNGVQYKAAVWFGPGTVVSIDECDFSAHSSSGAATSSAVYVTATAATTVRNSNFLSEQDGGLEIEQGAAGVLVDNCRFLNNQSRGAIRIASGSGVIDVVGCFFAGNSRSTGQGGALYCPNGALLTVQNCAFTNNSGYSIYTPQPWYSFVGGCVFCGPRSAELFGNVVEIGLNTFDVACGADCDVDGLPDVYEISSGLDTDCNANGVPDSCDADSGSDCNNNGTPDACDLADGTAADCNANAVPDSCEADCDADGTPDACEIASGASDCDANGVPDSCQADCDSDGVIDSCEIAAGATDCDADGTPDACEIATVPTLDFNNDGTLDSCQPAMQFAGLQLEIQPIVGRGTDDLFPAGAVCYRLYARVTTDGASAVGIYGNSQFPMVLNATGGFWQSPFGGDLSVDVACNDTAALPSYRFDSWFTVGKECALGNATQNTGLDLAAFNAGGGVNDADGIVFVAPGSPQANGGAARRVLLAQLTTTRPVFPTGTVNVVGRSNGGSGPENAWLALGQQIPMPALVDCNGNGEHDAFDIAKGVALDCDQSGVPDTCEHPSAVTDCNGNGISDLCDCYSGFSSDINTNNVPDECECTGDIDANGVVDVDDIIWVLVAWGADGTSEADVNSDGIVNGADLAIVLQGWGQCS